MTHHTGLGSRSTFNNAAGHACGCVDAVLLSGEEGGCCACVVCACVRVLCVWEAVWSVPPRGANFPQTLRCSALTARHHYARVPGIGFV